MMAKPYILDFSPLSLEKQDGDLSPDDYTAVSKQLVKGLIEYGYIYLTNCGVDNVLIEKSKQISGRFFELPINLKKPYAFKGQHGWFGSETEWTNPNAPGDLKEAFNASTDTEVWPDEEVPDLRQMTIDVIKHTQVIAKRVMRALAFGLDLENKEFFDEHHKTMTSHIRYAWYPTPTQEIKPGQLRCGEHTDWGSITLIFQDDVGGLQVCTRSGEWLDAPPVDGAVLMQVGDMIQRWTADKIQSLRHRVVIPASNAPRRSMILFVVPDDDAIVKCIDGSDTYKPITMREYATLKHYEIRA